MTVDSVDHERLLLGVGALSLAVAATLLVIDRHGLALVAGAAAAVAITRANGAAEAALDEGED